MAATIGMITPAALARCRLHQGDAHGGHGFLQPVKPPLHLAVMVQLMGMGHGHAQVPVAVLDPVKLARDCARVRATVNNASRNMLSDCQSRYRRAP